MLKKLLAFYILIVLTGPVWGVTRFYLPASGAAAVNPTYNAGWEKTSQADNLRCVTPKLNTAMASKTSSENVSTNPYDVLTRQYVSDPIAGQTISGTLKGQIRVMESNNLANFNRAIVVYVVSNDGATVRGTLLSIFGGGTEYDNAFQNRNFPESTVLSSVNAQNGDRIVIEIGTRSTNTAATNRTATHSFGDDSANDLAEDESTTTANNPWIEFSGDIIFPRVTLNC